MNIDHMVPSVERALLLMEFLGQSEQGATQQELAEALEITPSTCYRILRTLKSRDWIRPASGGRFVVAGGILRAALCVADRFARFESAKPILQKLSRETGLSCKMSIRQGDEQVTVLREESPKPMCVSGRVGARFPVIEGSVGAALLSGESEAFIRACAAACREMIPETETPELILNRVLEIRSKGYCLVDSRERWHVLAISAPIRDREGRVNAAVTLLGFPEDFEKEAMAHLVARLRAATKACALLVTERGGAQDENRGVSARCATRAPRSSANKEKR